jgi:hypothetical protein
MYLEGKIIVDCATLSPERMIDVAEVQRLVLPAGPVSRACQNHAYVHTDQLFFTYWFLGVADRGQGWAVP